MIDPSTLAELDFELLSKPVDGADEWLARLIEGSPLLVALGIACLLGLRHASDPDHLLAVTALVASEPSGARRGAHLGAWWGLGHATTLIAIGIPLIVFTAQLPGWLERGAERAAGLVIIFLALRVIWQWVQGDSRSHGHSRRPSRKSRLPGGDDPPRPHGQARTPRQAFTIGTIHGLAGTGAIILLLLAAMPSELEAVLALAAFAPMSVVSMAAWTTAFAWVLTRPIVEPAYRTVVLPLLGLFGLMFGLWYVGIT